MRCASLLTAAVVGFGLVAGWMAQPAVLGRPLTDDPDTGDGTVLYAGKQCSFKMNQANTCGWDMDGSIHCMACGSGDTNGVACGGTWVIPTPPPAGVPAACAGLTMKSTNGGCTFCYETEISAPIDDTPVGDTQVSVPAHAAR